MAVMGVMSSFGITKCYVEMLCCSRSTHKSTSSAVALHLDGRTSKFCAEATNFSHFKISMKILFSFSIGGYAYSI